MGIKGIGFLIVFMVLHHIGFAETVFLKNGDKVSGSIIEQADGEIVIQHDVLGELRIKKEFVEDILLENVQQQSESPHLEIEEKKTWDHQVSFGYNQASGNTEERSLSIKYETNRRFQEREWKIKAQALYSSRDGKMNARKYYGHLEHNEDFEEGSRWFRTYKFQADHDRFANIDYRLIPLVGTGYRFKNDDVFQSYADVSLGYEYTEFRDDTKSEGEIILVPHFFLEKSLTQSLTFIQDLTLYTALGDILGESRIRSETAFKQRMSEQLFWTFSFVNEYDAGPAFGTEHSDYRILTEIDYQF